jgi:hypothetical protein
MGIVQDSVSLKLTGFVEELVGEYGERSFSLFTFTFQQQKNYTV